MRILRAHVVGLIGRHVFRAHSFTVAAPRLATILGDPDASAGNANANDVRVARIDNDGMNARIVGATTDPTFSIRMTPEALDERPAIAVVGRMKQATGDRAAPGLIGVVRPARLECPDGLDVPRNRFVAHGIEILDVVGLLRILRRRALFPSPSSVARVL